MADWAATAQEGAWELVESAWVVVEFLALVRFRVISSEVETALAANLQYYSERGHKNREIPRLRFGMTNYCSHLS